MQRSNNFDSLNSLEENNWEMVGPKKPAKKPVSKISHPMKNVSLSKNSPNKSSPSKNSPNKSSPKPKPSKALENFKQLDANAVILQSEKEIMREIFTRPCSSEEYDEALKFVCDKYGAKNTDWYAVSEATNIVHDRRRIEKGLKPILSDTLREPIVVNFPDPIQYEEEPIDDEIVEDESVEELLDGKLHPLPHAMALICEWQSDSGKNEWKSKTVAVMKNVDDFWTVINSLICEGSDSKFTLPLEGKEPLAKEIFAKLIASGRKRNEDDVVDIESHNQKKVTAIISQYNSLFPVWSFVKVADNVTIDSKIEVPFVRVNGRVGNEVSLNLGDTKVNAQNGIHVMNSDFSDGYLVMLLLNFIGGVLPDEIQAIPFSKTIAVNGTRYFKGCRVRILLKSTDQKSLTGIKNYLEKDFIQNHSKCDYSKCVVRISVPK